MGLCYTWGVNNTSSEHMEIQTETWDHMFRKHRHENAHAGFIPAGASRASD